jgi:hypothetical protein
VIDGIGQFVCHVLITLLDCWCYKETSLSDLSSSVFSCMFRGNPQIMNLVLNLDSCFLHIIHYIWCFLWSFAHNLWIPCLSIRTDTLVLNFIDDYRSFFLHFKGPLLRLLLFWIYFVAWFLVIGWLLNFCLL